MRVGPIFVALFMFSASVQPGVAEDIKIAIMYGKTGPLEAYAKQTEIGAKLAVEYATKGTNQIDGKNVVLIFKDDQSKPDLGKSLLAEAFQDDKADIAIGSTSSAVTVAMLPVLEEYKKILIVEPSAADQITGAKWNRYVFRTSRNTAQDAIAAAKVIGGKDVFVATLAQDYAFGRDFVASFKETLPGTGAELVAEEYLPITANEFTAVSERMFNALKDKKGRKIIYVYWVGPSPIPKIAALKPERYGIEFSTFVQINPVMRAYKGLLNGAEGHAGYFQPLPANPMNMWLLSEAPKKFGTETDVSIASGFTAVITAVESIRRARSTDTEKLIATMEGMEFDTPKGKMIFRKEDHQALQTMYHVKFRDDAALEWETFDVVRELSPEETAPPIRNKVQ
jgi:branched-chain amino acid transport system substrate-binding protein